MKYYKCECGSDEFVRIYNVWNEKIKVQLTKDEKGNELWNIENHGKIKDHLYGHVCKKCGKDATELNDSL